MSEAAAVVAPSAPAEGNTEAPVTAPEGNPKVPAEAKPADDRITVKVNGKLRTMTRDEAVREIQKSSASRENFEKAAKLTQKNQTLLKALSDKAQREKALEDLGVPLDEVLEERLARRAQQAQMTPEQRRIAELEAQIARQTEESTTTAQKLEEERFAAQEKQIWEKTEADYITHIDAAAKAGKLGGLQPSEALYLMAEAAEMNLGYGLDLTPEELLAEARTKVDGAKAELQQKLTHGLQGEALLEFLGMDAVNAVLRAARQKFIGGGPVQALQKPAPIAEPSQEPQKRRIVRPNEVKTPWL